MDESVTIEKKHKVLQTASEEIAHYVIGFAKLVENRGIEDALLAGSGTLITIDRMHGILTADHVLENLPEAGQVGLILATMGRPELHRLTIDMQLAEKVRIARGKVESEGPDLGILVLPPANIGIISASKSFYNLSGRCEDILSCPTSIDKGAWLLSGLIEERTTEAEPEAGFQKVKVFRGICGGGIVKGESERKGFDYLDFEANAQGLYEGPESFKGLSGGGLWQFLISKSKEGEIEVTDKILSGVAFYQSSWENRVLNINCHGRQSIYGTAIEAVRKNVP